MNSNITKGESLFAEGRIEEAEQIFLLAEENSTNSKEAYNLFKKIDELGVPCPMSSQAVSNATVWRHCPTRGQPPGAASDD